MRRQSTDGLAISQPVTWRSREISPGPGGGDVGLVALAPSAWTYILLAKHQLLRPSAIDVMSAVNATLVVSVTGIVVSGVVGPQLTAWSTRRANRKQFNRDQAVRRRDDLRSILDDAALLLASGATNLRRMREESAGGHQASVEPRNWASQIFPLGQRLRLRLPADHQVVRAYDDVREALVAAAAQDAETAIANFEAKRDRFLDLARNTLDSDIPEGGGSQ